MSRQGAALDLLVYTPEEVACMQDRPSMRQALATEKLLYEIETRVRRAGGGGGMVRRAEIGGGATGVSAEGEGR